MSEYDDWDDDNQADGSGSNALQEARAAAKANAKKVKELSAQLDQLRGTVRANAVKDVLTAKGLPEKIARFIPPEATTSDEVEAWLTENGDVFGIQAEAGKQDAQQARPELDAMNRISSVQSSGQPFSNDPDQLEALIKSADSAESLNMLLFGSKLGPQAI